MKLNLNSISSKLMMGGVVIALVPMVIIGGLSYSKAGSALMDLSSEQSQGIASDLAHTINAILQAEIGKAASMAAQREMIELTAAVETDGVEACGDLIKGDCR